MPAGRPRVTHGKSRTPEFGIWWSMRQRCENQNDRNFHNYGGRGIRVCERWTEFASFLSDMGVRPSPKHSIDRIDVNGDYCAENCRWIEMREQFKNMRKNVKVTINGVTKIAKDWAREYGRPYKTVLNRLAAGWDPVAALTVERSPVLGVTPASGATGVYYHPNTRRERPWQARIHENGKFRSLGYYATKEEAIAARAAAQSGLPVPPMMRVRTYRKPQPQL